MESQYDSTHHVCKYKIKKIAIISKDLGEPVDILTQSITGMTIIEDFNQFLQPIFQIDIILPPLVLNYISAHKKDVSFLIRFQKEDFITSFNESGEESSLIPNGVSDICNDEFVSFLTDNARNENLGVYKSMVDVIESGTKNDYIYQIKENLGIISNYTNQYTLFLWKESDVFGLRKTVNYVFSNTAIGDATAFIAANSGFKNILMEPSDNSKPYLQIIVPPMSTMNVFNYLQETYGLYKTDVLLYLGLDRSYIIDKSGFCKAYEENEYIKTTIVVGSSYTLDSIDSGIHLIKEKNERVINTDISKIFLRSLSEIHNIIQGNGNMFIDSRNNETTTTNTPSLQRGDSCINVTTDQEGSEFTKHRVQNNIDELYLNIKITGLSAYDMEAFSPNKEFIIRFRNPESYVYNGHYRITKTTHVLSRFKQGDDMSIEGIFEFVKKSNLSDSEYKETEYSVHQTATLDENRIEKSKSQANEININEPSFAQSEINQIKEGKKPQIPETVPGLKDIDPTTPEFNKIKPGDSLDVINSKLKAQKDLLEEIKEKNSVYPVKDQPINQDILNDLEKINIKKPKNILKGSKAPIPLDEK